jgi:hypothetical protein
MPKLTYGPEPLELRVLDSGIAEGFTVFVDDVEVEHVDEHARRYAIPRPEGTIRIVVQFGGRDGGTSAIFNATTENVIALERGFRHEYEIEA